MKSGSSVTGNRYPTAVVRDWPTFFIASQHFTLATTMFLALEFFFGATDKFIDGDCPVASGFDIRSKCVKRVQKMPERGIASAYSPSKLTDWFSTPSDCGDSLGAIERMRMLPIVLEVFDGGIHLIGARFDELVIPSYDLKARVELRTPCIARNRALSRLAASRLIPRNGKGRQCAS